MNGSAQSHASSSRSPLSPDEVVAIQAGHANLKLAAPNVCRWIPPPVRIIDDKPDDSLETRDSHRICRPGKPVHECARVLASGTMLQEHLTAHISKLGGISVVEKAGKGKAKTKHYFECLWSGCSENRFSSRQALLVHALRDHVHLRRPCPFVKCPSPPTTTFTAAEIIPHIKRGHLKDDPGYQTWRTLLPVKHQLMQPKAPDQLDPPPLAVPSYKVRLGLGCGTPRVRTGFAMAPAQKDAVSAEEAFLLEMEDGIWKGMEDLNPSEDEEEEEKKKKEEALDPKGKGKAKEQNGNVQRQPPPPIMRSSPPKSRPRLSSSAAVVLSDLASPASSPSRSLKRKECEPPPPRSSSSRASSSRPASARPSSPCQRIPPDPSSSNSPTVPSSLESSAPASASSSQPQSRPAVPYPTHRPNRFPGLPIPFPSHNTRPSDPPAPPPAPTLSSTPNPRPDQPVPIPGKHLPHSLLIPWPASHPIPEGPPRDEWPERYEEVVREWEKVVERGEEKERKRVEGKEIRDGEEFVRQMKEMGGGAEGGGGEGEGEGAG